MNETIQSAVDGLTKKFNAQVQEFRGEITVTVAPENIIPALTALRDEFEFNMMMDATAVDYYPQETPRFHVIYQMYSMPNNVRMQVRVHLNGNAPKLDSVEMVFPVANWKEREIYDLFGIQFTGHSDLRRVIMPEDWTGHPLRKDYPLGYEEVQFTFNFGEIMANKPHPKD